MRFANFLFTAGLLASLTLHAQQPQPAVRLQTVVQPGMTIGGRSFGRSATIYGAALNDVDEIAFSACLEEEVATAAVFTSQRVVAQQGDIFDGKTLMNIRLDAPVAINRAGQVMYQAYFGDTPEIAKGGEYSGLGLFVDNHLALRLTTANMDDAFGLTEDGQVVPQESNPRSAGSAPAPPEKKPGLLDRVRINPLRLPKGPSISLGPDGAPRQRASAPRYGERTGLPDAPSLLRANRRGQIAIPVNVAGQGFLLLIATPAAR